MQFLLPRLKTTWVVLALALPWLNPLTFGPTSSAAQSLLTAVCAALVLAVFAWQRNPLDLATVSARAWLLAAALSAVLGLLQYFGFSAALAPWVNYAQPGEAFANLRQRNQFATLSSIGLAALLWWQSTGPAGRPTAALALSAMVGSKLSRFAVFLQYTPWVPLAMAVLLGAGLAASASRAGLLQLLLLLGLSLWWGGWRRAPVRRVLVAAALAYVVAALVLPLLLGQERGILSRFNEPAESSYSRVVLWGNVLHLIAQKPWLGWGWGELDFAHFITVYPGARFNDLLDNAHNLPLHLAVELGLPLALLICTLLLLLVWRGQPWREANATRQMAWSVLAAIGLHSLLEYPLWYGPFQLAVVLCVLLLSFTPGTVQTHTRPLFGGVIKPLALATRGLLAGCLLAMTTWVGWDYVRVSQIYLPPAVRLPAFRDKPLEAVQGLVFFQDQLKFADFAMVTLTPDNAASVRARGLELLHFSPEASVLEKLIASQRLLGRLDEAAYYLERFQASYPDKYQKFIKNN
jgi:O-antigen ligase